MLQRLVASPQRRRVWSHVYFLGRLEEECFKSPELGTSFALLRLRLPDDLVDLQVGSLVSPALSPFDLIARYGTRDWELLLPGKDRDAAEATFARIRAELGQRGADARGAIAVYGADGRDPAALIASTSAALYQGGGGATIAQTQLLAVGPRMQSVFRLLERAAAAKSPSANILLLGETGVGKTALASWNPCSVAAGEPTLPPHRSRGRSHVANRKRAVRAQEGGVHWRLEREGRPTRERARGDAAPRRGRRALPGDAAQAADGSSGASDQAGG